MIGRLCLAISICLLAQSAAASCPPEDDRVIFHSCHGAATAELLLLPEEANAIATDAASEGIVVGGTYTGTDRRSGNRPKPVGLFVDQGQVISPNLARMDGILTIDRAGRPELHHAKRVPIPGGTADLTDLDQRLDFADWAAENDMSVLQSHLVIVDGKLDIRPQPDAPRAQRRMLFSGPAGWGVYQTRGAVTLFDAASELARRVQPDMALNLDMGSYDYCLAIRDGSSAPCGLLGPTDTEKLSNLLRFSRPAS